MTILSLPPRLVTNLKSREWRLDNLYWIVDESGTKIRFRRNQAQREFWGERHYWNLILKARQRGISTFIALLMLDTALFRANTHCGLIDATLDDAKKKLDKIRFAYENLFDELRQSKPLISDNSQSLEWANGSRIDVGTSHRGGTLQILHVSEMGKIAATQPARSKEIRTGAFGTVHRGSMVFVESTAEGAAGDFYDLVQSADVRQRQSKSLRQTEFKLIFLPWHTHESYREDPDGVVIDKPLAEYFHGLEHKHGIVLDDAQRAWYALKRQAVGIDDMFREYPSYPDEAFKVSVEGAYFRTAMNKAREQGRIGYVPHDSSRPVHTCWDIGKNDKTAIWFFQSHGKMVHHIDYYENDGEGVEHYSRYLRERALERDFIYGKHYGPHDLDNSLWIMPGEEATVDVARRMGIDFIVVPRIPNKQDAIEAGRNWLSMCWIDEEHCAQGIRCLDNYRKAWDENRGCYRDHEHVDWTNDGADALMTGACGFTPDYIPPPSDRYQRKRVTSSAWAA